MCSRSPARAECVAHRVSSNDSAMSVCTKAVLIAAIILFALAIGRAMASAESADTESESPKILGYIDEIPPESSERRAERLRKVAERRASLPLMVHRGAATFAPENTLEAFNAAMDEGADGVEIDIHRTADGVLYLMHDDTVNRTTSGSGKGREMTYYEMLQFNVNRAPSKNTRVPTFAAFLELARQRAILIHLDVKQGGLQDDIERMIQDADMWDHIVECNYGNADRLRDHPKVNLLQYKGWLPERRGEPDMHEITYFLGKDGNMIFCKDVQFSVRALDRPKPEKPVPLSDNLRAWWASDGILPAEKSD